jgi:hypothetical protein
LGCDVVLAEERNANSNRGGHLMLSIKKVFTKNFWYSISQLVLGKALANKKPLPNDIFSNWKSFSSRYKETVYKMDDLVTRYCQCLATACVEAATCYNNMIVECFQSGFMSYLIHTIRALVKQVISIDPLYCTLLALINSNT